MNSRLLALLASTSLAAFAAVPAAHAEDVLTADVTEPTTDVKVDTDVKIDDGAVIDLVPVETGPDGVDEAPGGEVKDITLDPVDEVVEIKDEVVEIKDGGIVDGGAIGGDVTEGEVTLDPSDPAIYETHIPLPEERIYTMTGGDVGDIAADNAAEAAADQAADRVIERVQARTTAQVTSDPQ